MTNHGDDCYFFYYSTCTKGDSCPFRHCEAAMGNETVCNLWQEGRCFRPTCKFRHMEITKNRKEIPCYWENQPAGCQKPHCAFFHEKPRCIQGLFVPPDQSQSKTEEEQPEDTAAPPPVVLTTSTNPQLRGVIKTDTTEPVPSPTHPPVVINAADDDEDEDEEGEDSRVGPSPRKLPRTGETLTFGVSTLEEIRLRKALMASMRSGYGQKAEGVANGEKENIQAFFRATSSQSRAGPPGSEVPVRSKRGVSERLGLRMPHTGGRGREGLPIRKSLAERLGGVIEEPAAPTQEGVKPVKDRLGLFSGPATAAHSGSPAEKNSVSVKDPDQIRIKTLEEIRREKAAKSQKDAPPDVPSDVPAEIPKTVRATRGVKRTVSVKEPPISNIKTFSEIHLAKKKRLEEKQARISKTAESPVEKPASRTPGESDTPEEGKEVKVRVKTLEEIRREKAARLQAQQDTESVESKDQESLPKKKRLLRVQKPETQNRIETSEDTPTTEKLQKPTKTGSVQVKTFEEIMREKRLRQQEGEGQASNSTDADGVRPPLKRKLPVQADPASSAPSSPADSPSVSVRKLVPLRSKAASNAQKISFQGRTGDVTETRSSMSPSEDQNQTGSTEQSGESKVRPKLNVKPSVVKLATPLRPAQKKRGAEPSAVAAVKPLNSATAVQETPQESTCTPPQVLPSPEALLNSAVPRSPTPLQESTLGEEELQRVPVFKQSGGQKAGAAIREACSVPHSPAVRTTAQSRARRTSTTRPTSTSESAAPAVDDFEELINQFTDDHLEEDVDPGLGEDDLLQELSEMIDS